MRAAQQLSPRDAGQQLPALQQQRHWQACNAAGIWQHHAASSPVEQRVAAAEGSEQLALTDHTGLLLREIADHQLLGGVDSCSQESSQQHSKAWVSCEGAAVMLLGDDADDDGEEECGEAAMLAMLKGKSKRRLTPSTTGVVPEGEAELHNSAYATHVAQRQQQEEQGHEELQQHVQPHQQQHVVFAEGVCEASLLPRHTPPPAAAAAATTNLPGLAASARASSAPERAINSAAAAAALPAGHTRFRRTASGVGASLITKPYTRKPSASFAGTITGHLKTAVSSISSLLHPFSRSASDAHASCGQRFEQQALQQNKESKAQNVGNAASRRRSRRQTDRQSCCSVLVLDMGLHKLPGLAEAVQLVSVLPPVLEGRAHYFPALNTLQQHTPGYLVSISLLTCM
jgi:hypothetical protein